MTLTVETWCEALESGKYKQAKGNLRVGEGYCCLGVACDLSGLGDWLGDRYAANDFSKTTNLPQPVQEMLGLCDPDGQFACPVELPEELAAEVALLFKDPEYLSLADLNDAGAPFPLIAKVIRARPKGLFREDV